MVPAGGSGRLPAVNPSEALATVLVDELAKNGVREVVLCPGSRSAPLAYAVLNAERAGEMHALENARLVKLQSAVWVTALTGHPDSVRTVLSVMERRAKLNGSLSL